MRGSDSEAGPTGIATLLLGVSGDQEWMKRGGVFDPCRMWARPDLNRGFPPCESGVITRLDHGPDRAV